MTTYTQAIRFVRLLPIVLTIVLFAGVAGTRADDGTHGTGDGFVPPPPPTGTGSGRGAGTISNHPGTVDSETGLETWQRFELVIWTSRLFFRFV